MPGRWSHAICRQPGNTGQHTGLIAQNSFSNAGVRRGDILAGDQGELSMNSYSLKAKIDDRGDLSGESHLDDASGDRSVDRGIARTEADLRYG